ncbi:acyl-CoA dehydrogenase [Zwartia vadi]|uniref:acyl-CoA dehydrogenase n=1 Tax=Zwartia vadi TaxID=3058168 RepID=UPI0025B4F9DB|nr:acyl-CoA dehydrogenase [Zwartia vadi]MDN3988833.1 acyl-CoA dehydrogenase [Zwartia vadi]
MTYRAPVEDFKFIFNYLVDMPGVLNLPAYSGVESDLVDAILEENAKFTSEVVAPTNRISDREPPVCDAGQVSMPRAIHETFKKFVEGGWQGLRHPEQWGGQGLPKLLATATTENLYAANVAFSLCPMLTDGVIEALLLTGSDTQKQTYIEPLVSARWTGTMNLTEPQSGSDLSLVTTRAVPQADGLYRLFGQKIYITFGEHDLAENIIHLVLARTADAPPGVKGLSLFIVPKFLVNADGSLGPRNDVWCASLEHKLGIHGSPTAVLLFGDGKGEVGEGAVGTLVGQENRGLEYMFIMMNAARFAVGVQGIGVSEAATQKAMSYARDRVQSRAIEGSAGPVSIIRHPDVQRMLMTMRALTEGARAIACMAAAADDLSVDHADAEIRRANQALYDYLVPVVKGFSTECSLEVSSLGVQVHGGMGFIEETGAAQFYRDARILTIYEGTTAIQANDLIGRKTLRDGGAVAEQLIESMSQTVAALRECANQTQVEHQAGLLLIADKLNQAVAHYASVVSYVKEQTQHNIRAVYAGSVPYLMLSGYVLGGWLMARAALVCAQEQSESLLTEVSPDFIKNKFATAVFYAGVILPRTQALADAIHQGVVLTQALDHSTLMQAS